MSVVPTEELPAKLEKYINYLETIENLLESFPEDEDLVKLKSYVEEVIQVTAKLLAPSTSGVQPRLPEIEKDAKRKRCTPVKWEVGDTCMAPRSQDGEFYEAVVEDITENKICTVTFVGYDEKPEFVFSRQLIPMSDDDDENTYTSDGSPASKRQRLEAEQRTDERKRRKRRVQAMARIRKAWEIERRKEIEMFENFLSDAFEDKEDRK